MNRPLQALIATPRRGAVQRRTAMLGVFVMLVGCATMSTSPPVSGDAAAIPLSGYLEFEGNREFLPGPLTGLPDAGPGADPIFHYRYDARYDETDLSVLALFNPLTLVGCPTGSVSVTTDAVLQVTSRGTVVKQYTAQTVAKRLRTIFSGDPLSALRRDALRASAKNIADQIAADGVALSTIFAAGTAPAAATNGGDR